MTLARGLQYYKQNRLQQLRGFCHAAQTGSISKAAEKLFLSQPSVSLQIQALERELKTTLFERRGPQDPAHARRQDAVRVGLAAGRTDRLAGRHLRGAPRRRRNRPARHRGRRIDHALPAAAVRQQFTEHYPGHRAEAAQRHRPRRIGDGAGRRGRFRRRLDARNARGHRVPADVHLRPGADRGARSSAGQAAQRDAQGRGRLSA